MSELTDKRGKTHGAWRQTAGCTQAIETALLIWRTADLKPHHREALHQIAVKMARINCGDPDFPDHFADIAGYADETAKLCRSVTNFPPEVEVPADCEPGQLYDGRICRAFTRQ